MTVPSILQDKIIFTATIKLEDIDEVVDGMPLDFAVGILIHDQRMLVAILNLTATESMPPEFSSVSVSRGPHCPRVYDLKPEAKEAAEARRRDGVPGGSAEAGRFTVKEGPWAQKTESDSDDPEGRHDPESIEIRIPDTGEEEGGSDSDDEDDLKFGEPGAPTTTQSEEGLTRVHVQKTMTGGTSSLNMQQIIEQIKNQAHGHKPNKFVKDTQARDQNRVKNKKGGKENRGVHPSPPTQGDMDRSQSVLRRFHEALNGIQSQETLIRRTVTLKADLRGGPAPGGTGGEGDGRVPPEYLASDAASLHHAALLLPLSFLFCFCLLVLGFAN